MNTFNNITISHLPFASPFLLFNELHDNAFDCFGTTKTQHNSILSSQNLENTCHCLMNQNA